MLISSTSSSPPASSLFGVLMYTCKYITLFQHRNQSPSFHCHFLPEFQTQQLCSLSSYIQPIYPDLPAHITNIHYLLYPLLSSWAWLYCSRANNPKSITALWHSLFIKMATPSPFQSFEYLQRYHVPHTLKPLHSLQLKLSLSESIYFFPLPLQHLP